MNWNHVLDKFTVINNQYAQLMQQLRPLLSKYVVHPVGVDSAEAIRDLPVLLASSLIPEMQQQNSILLQAEACAPDASSIQVR